MATTAAQYGLSTDSRPGQDGPPLLVVDKNELRSHFAAAMSAMYKAEVPLYGDLIEVVNAVNQVCNRGRPFEKRLGLERHGAIRLGTPDELRTIRRVFEQFGLHAVDYYDLSVAGLPVHATAFRPVDAQSLSKNPFRVFTSLLRPELLKPGPRELALRLVSQRSIFSADLLDLLQVAEKQDGLLPDQADRFILEALKTFKWHSVAAATYDDYQVLATEHPILADIVCFNTAHINHLTPRTLDIEAAAVRMKQQGLSVKSRIEGPPRRDNPILLRQTSFLALREHVSFPLRPGSEELVPGFHRARFGEIEQRGAALTPKGRRLYDTVLDAALQQIDDVSSAQDPEERFKEAFSIYTDDWQTLVREGLVFFQCQPTASGKGSKPTSSRPGATTVLLSQLLKDGLAETVPIIYEDFLPISAAGIFRSNLHSTSAGATDGLASEPESSLQDRAGLESALGLPIFNSEDLYAVQQAESLRSCAISLGVPEIVNDISETSP